MLSEEAFIAAQRFGLGVAYDEVTRIGRNPVTWLRRQLVALPEPARSGTLLSSADILRIVAKLRHADRRASKKGKYRQEARKIYLKEMRVRLNLAASSEQPFVERLVHFWSNHFTVSRLGKGKMIPFVGAFEREAIRPHVLGRFSDMLKAVSQHPAMLLYLDNERSLGPNSQAGRARGRGLNENLAREILELHTLGVDGGYGQEDVIALAKILTGWGLMPRKSGGGGFRFWQEAHEPGAHRLLGNSYRQEGMEQGLAALDDLAAHPSTARFLSGKLAAHFVSDRPRTSTISALTRVFEDSDGNLRAMAEALIDLEEIWQNPLAKLKTPYELILSSMRLMNEDKKALGSGEPWTSLKVLGHMPFSAPSPAGWPDRAEDWVSPGPMMARIEWAYSFADAVRPSVAPVELARAAIGPVAYAETLRWIERAPSPVDGFALLLASPEWQRR